MCGKDLLSAVFVGLNCVCVIHKDLVSWSDVFAHNLRRHLGHLRLAHVYLGAWRLLRNLNWLLTTWGVPVHFLNDLQLCFVSLSWNAHVHTRSPQHVGMRTSFNRIFSSSIQWELLHQATSEHVDFFTLRLDVRGVTVMWNLDNSRSSWRLQN